LEAVNKLQESFLLSNSIKKFSDVLELLHSGRWTDEQCKVFLQLLVKNIPEDYHIFRTSWSLSRINAVKVYLFMYSFKDEDLHLVNNKIEELPYLTHMKKQCLGICRNS
jgi:hypothetical protein